MTMKLNQNSKTVYPDIIFPFSQWSWLKMNPVDETFDVVTPRIYFPKMFKINWNQSQAKIEENFLH